MNRREVLGTGLAVAVFPVVGSVYRTPRGDEPLERLIDGVWVEYPFDDLQEEDVFRRQREPQDKYRMCGRFGPGISARLI